jgi:FG-GAP repeat
MRNATQRRKTLNRKKDWFVALALSVTMVGVASAHGGYIELDGVKGEVEKKRPKGEKGAEKPKDIATKPEKPRGLLLPAVQKASDMTPDTLPPSPRKSRPNVAAGDVNGDGRADVATPRQPAARNAGQGRRSGSRGVLNQIRTNE